MFRSILRTLRRILMAPVRLITWPYRRLQRFLSYEPEETSTVDVFSKAIESPSILVEHLEALRGHLLRSVAVLALTTGLSFAVASKILAWLTEPIGGIQALQAIEVTESIGAYMRVSLLSGFALAFPYICFEFFAFINPGLRRRERLLILTAIPAAFVLFLTGLAFAYFVMLPAALPFLLNFMGISTRVRPMNYVRFVTGLMFWIGVSFQFPLVIYALAAIGIVNARALMNGWRFAVVGIAVLAAAVTPTVDPVNMALVMAPMVVLYFMSIGLAAIAGRRREPAEA
ncbi:MAG TPA: twin-arginine translocase subunit TatC [Anaerolineales bacterium]|nr:twin-arginine translocase subunit TatC [Anaerolineales bacterium]